MFWLCWKVPWDLIGTPFPGNSHWRDVCAKVRSRCSRTRELDPNGTAQSVARVFAVFPHGHLLGFMRAEGWSHLCGHSLLSHSAGEECLASALSRAVVFLRQGVTVLT